MAEKGELLRRIPSVKLWLVLTFTLAYTVVLLVADYTTHSLTLRVEVYHALYNLFSLIGCLLTMKLCSRPQSLHNTFGWARLEVLSMLTTLLFLTALCFSVAVEAIQTAVHAGHQDAMHHPLQVLMLGVVGLAINGVVFCLIGGYTHHQGCFLEMRPSGGVWVGRQVTQEAVQAGRRTLSSRNLKAGAAKPSRISQGVLEVLRDICGVLLMMVCAAVVYWDDGGTIALYIDPGLAVTSAALLMWFSFPYGKECCHILLQTIPGHIDVEEFQARFLQEFPAILNVHHLHIWTFTPENVVATVHVVFPSPQVYLNMKAALTHFFHEEGITKVTLQPEYLGMGTDEALDTTLLTKGQVCLLRCENEHCFQKECCHDCCHQELTTVNTTRPRVLTANTKTLEESVPTNTGCIITNAPCKQVNSEAGEGKRVNSEAGEGVPLEKDPLQPKTQREIDQTEQPEEEIPFLKSKTVASDDANESRSPPQSEENMKTRKEALGHESEGN
ncbi:cation diffusion facilitator family protein 1-like isoform X1 [Penaeus monodon]|uniref:cation diffusion facilitator family protein 1-like isoform X1 n=1 Tax=Penaeus monodon TaxID=6687 RepID=UPI0018A7D00B|nr:cation diffusion facilitator family protein 1-like isoform X1 [Penaeus monodon]XP_037797554.1 cation diffusion facilitator family protein 1-like isoform X1 [Penaeus monodon]XP_037797555.1 cation diffusion facilitator family protein 1-like isoform X1 [Penaeus monodon]XP_037797556.1 cation diffusion facilitator family protein 1-like isoform X1 [Penaeus monodon]XP_037797557.1 cation diffusion facilitator family protein 1-like isoform X1 [Penaeus monodon]